MRMIGRILGRLALVMACATVLGLGGCGGKPAEGAKDDPHAGHDHKAGDTHDHK